MPGHWWGKPGPFGWGATHTKHPFGNGRRGSWHRASSGSSTLAPGGKTARRLSSAPDAQPPCLLMGIAGSTCDGRPILRFLRLWVTPRRIHPVAAIGAGKTAGLAGADNH